MTASRIREEIAEAAAQLLSNEKAYHVALHDYHERVANARARCPHAAVIAETSQCYTTYTCRDCGQYSTEPFGGGDA